MTPAKKPVKVVVKAPAKQRTFRLSTVIGFILFVFGLGGLTAHWFWHHQWHTQTSLFFGAFVLLGALLVVPDDASKAANTLAGVVRKLWPWGKKE